MTFLSNFLRDWFIRPPRAIQGLATGRMILGAYLLIFVGVDFLHRDILWGDASSWAAPARVGMNNWPIWAIKLFPNYVGVLLAVLALAGLLITIGYFTRPALVLAIYLQLSFLMYNPLAASYGDYVWLFVACGFLLARADYVSSLHALLLSKAGGFGVIKSRLPLWVAVSMHNAGVVYLRGLLAVFSVAALIGMAINSTWTNGRAFYYLLSDLIHSPWPVFADWAADNSTVMLVLSFGIMVGLVVTLALSVSASTRPLAFGMWLVLNLILLFILGWWEMAIPLLALGSILLTDGQVATIVGERLREDLAVEREVSGEQYWAEDAATEPESEVSEHGLVADIAAANSQDVDISVPVDAPVVPEAGAPVADFQPDLPPPPPASAGSSQDPAGDEPLEIDAPPSFPAEHDMTVNMPGLGLSGVEVAPPIPQRGYSRDQIAEELSRVGLTVDEDDSLSYAPIQPGTPGNARSSGPGLAATEQPAVASAAPESGRPSGNSSTSNVSQSAVEPEFATRAERRKYRLGLPMPEKKVTATPATGSLRDEDGKVQIRLPKQND